MRRAISKARAAFVIALGAACVLALIVLALWALFPQLARQAGERFEVVSRFPIRFGSKEHWSHPVISDGVLYVRRGTALAAFDIREKK